jgi:hypothetical protein
VRRSPIRLVVPLAIVHLAACGSRIAHPAAGPGSTSSAAAIDQFLQLAKQKNYLQMGWVFGTAEGAVNERWPAPEVERRMYALASVLDYDSYIVGTGNPVPGRVGGAERFTVRMRNGARNFDVPFTVVRGPGQRWFVEQVDVESVTGR